MFHPQKKLYNDLVKTQASEQNYREPVRKVSYAGGGGKKMNVSIITAVRESIEGIRKNRPPCMYSWDGDNYIYNTVLTIVELARKAETANLDQLVDDYVLQDSKYATLREMFSCVSAGESADHITDRFMIRFYSEDYKDYRALQYLISLVGALAIQKGEDHEYILYKLTMMCHYGARKKLPERFAVLERQSVQLPMRNKIQPSEYFAEGDIRLGAESGSPLRLVRNLETNSYELVLTMGSINKRLIYRIADLYARIHGFFGHKIEIDHSDYRNPEAYDTWDEEQERIRERLKYKRKAFWLSAWEWSKFFVASALIVGGSIYFFLNL